MAGHFKVKFDHDSLEQFVNYNAKICYYSKYKNQGTVCVEIVNLVSARTRKATFMEKSGFQNR